MEVNEINNLLDVMKESSDFASKDMPIQYPEISDTTEEWLNWRQHGPAWRDPSSPEYIPVTVGGSDASKCVGLNPWATLSSLYYQKRNRQPLKATDQTSDALVSGHIFEPAVAELLKKSLADMDWIQTLEFGNDTHMYRCGQKNPDGSLKYPWAIADFDRIAVINGVPYICELKTTTEDNKKALSLWKQGIVPDYYMCQVRHYMAVANIDHAVICCVWGLRTAKSAIIFIDRDMDAEQMLMDAESRFVDCVECGIEPDKDDESPEMILDDYQNYFGVKDTKAAPAELSEEYGETLKELQDAKKYLDTLNAKVDAADINYKRLQAKLLSAFVTADGKELCSCAYYNDEETGNHITALLSMCRKEVDSVRLKAEHPEVFEKVANTSVSLTNINDYDKKNKTSYGKVYVREKAVSPSVKVTITPLDKE